jgi:EAL domain-containing protein (putative c-di-GMP-specific phosphodiesterase class I)
MDGEVARRSRLATDLRRALERGELALAYQPQFDARSLRIVGAEALLRWRHPELGPVPPTEFIDVAEQNGLIARLGEWTLREACREARRWPHAGQAPLRIAVNVSAQQLRRGSLAERVAEALAESGLPAACLELEITEKATMADEGEAAGVLRTLRGLGLRLALDDFGTGYSPLTYVKRLPIDAVKIDRSFVAEIGASPAAEAIAKAIIGMAHGLNLQVVAEGVETAAQEVFLRDHRCDLLQGFRLGEPVPAEALRALLEPERLAGPRDP